MKQWLGMILGFLAACGIAADGNDSFSEICREFKEKCRNASEIRMQMPLEKLQYVVAWGVSYDLEALLDGYLATGDRRYLDWFVPLAERVVAARADKLGEKDWRGRLRSGWLADEYYGTGGPVVLLDETGNSSLEVCSTLLSYNQLTDLFVTVDAAGRTFSLEAVNPRGGPRNGRRKYENLTMDTVEHAVNSGSGRHMLRVRRIGNKPPVAVGPVRTPGNRFVMHGHHTGKAVIPLIRFALTVKQQPALSADYGKAAEDFLRCAEESMADMHSDWREHPDGGYIIFERGMPFWCDGVAEPNNTLALSGLAYLYLADATGRDIYRERARQLASFMRREIVTLPDGTATFYYWSRVNRHGWTSGESVYTPNYPIKTPTVEDCSHLQHSLRFFVECFRRKLVITNEDMRKLAGAFHKRIDRGDQDKPLAERMDGSLINSSGYQHFQAGWAEFYEIDPSIPARLWEIFLQKQRDDKRSSALATWGVLLRYQSGIQADRR